MAMPTRLIAEHSTVKDKGFFSILKRGMKGMYQHCAERHICTVISPSSIFAKTPALGLA